MPTLFHVPLIFVRDQWLYLLGGVALLFTAYCVYRGLGGHGIRHALRRRQRVK